MSIDTLHQTENNIELLKYLHDYPQKTFTHKELVELGFDLSEASYALVRHLIIRNGMNHMNYTYRILPNGIGFVEEIDYKQKQSDTIAEYRKNTIETAKDANKIAREANALSKSSNKLSKWAIGISICAAIGTIGSFIVAIIVA